MSTEQAEQAAAEPSRARYWVGEAWYYGRLWVLAACALAMVCFMASAILLANFPSLAGPVIGPKLNTHPVVAPADPAMHQRWRYPGPDVPMNPVGPEERIRPGVTAPGSTPPAP